MNKYVQVQDVAMAFETKKGRFVALSGVDLNIAQGEFVALIGHSGCGNQRCSISSPVYCNRHPAGCFVRDEKLPGRVRNELWCFKTIHCYLG